MSAPTRCLLAVTLVLAACSPPPAGAPDGAAPAAGAAAGAAATAQQDKVLAMYRQMLAAQQWELAAPIGQEIVAKYPGSSAAAEVQQTLADASAKAEAEATRRRLAALWIYQSGKESGADQVTASIYSRDLSPANRVRLILRRHAKWGQSVYLFGSGKGFVCKGVCMLEASFDDKPARLAAFLPDTGEPAIFIKDDKGFIARLEHTGNLTIKVTEKGKQARMLTFEVGGYDAAKFPQLAVGRKP
ncbi:MAG: hypothetical protein KF903_13860 [Dokdonella sp.]|uniref:hypothetical protein n=1 Tax=Dokdonella sp. TaxID=2291710 RepID=UPI0025C6C3D3|nr:hypothetical protein [Dokdonella sp.]MBX3702073.1 hypothetical protein [Dokdonella sp.]